MADIDWLALISRWLHVASFIGLVGGTFYIRVILLPSADVLSAEQHEALRNRMLARWKFYVHSFIALLLLSGTYNILVRWPAVKKVPLYHGLLGVKIILALFVMFVASAMVGRSKGLEGMRRNPSLWLSINLIIAGIIILMSGVMRFIPFTPQG